MVMAGNTPTASFLTKIGKMQLAGCRPCSTARQARGESTDGLAVETHGHICSAGCEGMTMTVMAAHQSIWRHLYHSMHAAQKPKSKLKFVTLDKESNMSALWRRQEFLRICSKEELAEKAQDVEVKIPIIYCILLIRIAFYQVSKNLPLHYLIYVNMNIYSSSILNIDTARDIVTVLMMIAFITINSGLVPLIEGLCAQISVYIF